MAQNIQLPDGTFFPMKEGETPEQALMAAASLYPDAFAPKKAEAGPQSGGIAALKSGVSGLKSDIAALLGRTGVLDQGAAEEYIAKQKEYQAKTFKPTEEGWTQAPVTKFTELLGGSVPYMAAPLAAGVAAAALPVAAPTAAVLGAAGAGAASFGQFTGAFLSRQMETGKKLGETELGTAALAALPAAALDTISLRMVPGIRNLLGAAGREVTEAEAKAIAQQNLGRTLGDYVATTGKVAGVEGLTESAQQVLERLQAGLSVTDEKAREEYIDSFLGGAILGGTLSVPGRFIERGGIKAKAAEAEAREKAEARSALEKQQEALRLEEEAKRKTPEYLDDLQDRFTQLKARERELTDATKGKVDANDPLAVEEKRRARSELGLFKTSKEYRDLQEEYRQAYDELRPWVEERKRQERLAAAPEGTQLDIFGQPAGMQDMSLPGQIQSLNQYIGSFDKQIKQAQTVGDTQQVELLQQKQGQAREQIAALLPDPSMLADAKALAQRNLEDYQTQIKTLTEQADKKPEQYRQLEQLNNTANQVRQAIAGIEDTQKTVAKYKPVEVQKPIDKTQELAKLEKQLGKQAELGEDQGPTLEKIKALETVAEQPALFGEEDLREVKPKTLGDFIADERERVKALREKLDSERAALQRMATAPQTGTTEEVQRRRQEVVEEAKKTAKELRQRNQDLVDIERKQTLLDKLLQDKRTPLVVQGIEVLQKQIADLQKKIQATEPKVKVQQPRTKLPEAAPEGEFAPRVTDEQLMEQRDRDIAALLDKFLPPALGVTPTQETLQVQGPEGPREVRLTTLGGAKPVTATEISNVNDQREELVDAYVNELAPAVESAVTDTELREAKRNANRAKNGVVEFVLLETDMLRQRAGGKLLSAEYSADLAELTKSVLDGRAANVPGNNANEQIDTLVEEFAKVSPKDATATPTKYRVPATTRPAALLGADIPGQIAANNRQIEQLNQDIQYAGKPDKPEKVAALNELKAERDRRREENKRLTEQYNRLQKPEAPAETGEVADMRQELATIERTLASDKRELEQVQEQLQRQRKEEQTPKVQEEVAELERRIKQFEARARITQQLEAARDELIGRIEAAVGPTRPEAKGTEGQLEFPTGVQRKALVSELKPVPADDITKAKNAVVAATQKIEDIRKAAARVTEMGPQYFREVATTYQQRIDKEAANKDRLANRVYVLEGRIEAQIELSNKLPVERQKDNIYLDKAAELRKELEGAKAELAASNRRAEAMKESDAEVRRFLNLARLAGVDKKTDLRESLAQALDVALADKDKKEAALAELEKKQRMYEQQDAARRGIDLGEAEAEKITAGKAEGFVSGRGKALGEKPKSKRSWIVTRDSKVKPIKPAQANKLEAAVQNAMALVGEARREKETAEKAAETKAPSAERITALKDSLGKLEGQINAHYTTAQAAELETEIKKLQDTLASFPVAPAIANVAEQYNKASTAEKGLPASERVAQLMFEKGSAELKAAGQLNAAEQAVTAANAKYDASRKALEQAEKKLARLKDPKKIQGVKLQIGNLNGSAPKLRDNIQDALYKQSEAEKAYMAARLERLLLNQQMGEHAKREAANITAQLAEAADTVTQLQEQVATAAANETAMREKLDKSSAALEKAEADAEAARQAARNAARLAEEKAKRDALDAAAEARRKAAEIRAGAGLPGRRVERDTSGKLMTAVQAEIRQRMAAAETNLSKAIKAGNQANIKKYTAEVEATTRELAQVYGKAPVTVTEVGVERAAAPQPAVVEGMRSTTRREGPAVRYVRGGSKAIMQSGVVKLRAAGLSQEAANAISIYVKLSQIAGAKTEAKKNELRQDLQELRQGKTKEELRAAAEEGRRLMGLGPTAELIAKRMAYQEALENYQTLDRAKGEAKTPLQKELAQDALAAADKQRERASDAYEKAKTDYELSQVKRGKQAAKQSIQDLFDVAAEGNLAEAKELGGRRAAAIEGLDEDLVPIKYSTATRTPADLLVQEAIRDGRLTDALDRLSNYGTNELIRQSAKDLKALVLRTKVIIDPNLTVDGEAVPAAYSPSQNAVMFRPDAISDEDIIHEVTHAATLRVMRMPESELTPRQLAAKREIQSIFEQLETRTDLATQYGLENAEEFISEVQSNVEFRAAIDNKPWYMRLWHAILRLFNKGPAEELSARASRLVKELYLPSAKIAGTSETIASVFRPTKPQYESENALTKLADQIIAQPKSFKEKLGSNLALEAEMNAVDMRAGLQEAIKRGAKDLGKDDLFTQAMYNVRKADQFMPLVYTGLSTGTLEFYTDEKGLRGIRSSNKNPAQDVFTAVKNVPGKNTQAKFALSSTYMIAQRAANKGLSKLDLGELGLTQADLDAAMAAANADPALKDALEEVRRRYNAYNEGQIKFLADAGKISKAEAAKWLKEGDYVPYYRVREDGTAELVFGGEKTLTVGDIRTQPYLAELKGGETKILPLNESLIRNTMLITKAALYNNATKEIAYAMQAFGEGKGKDGKNSMPINRGQGPAGSDIIRFTQEPDPRDPKDDGQRWQRIKTEGTAMEGIPAELVVKSLEGAHLTLPAFLKIGGIAGDWLRKGVTRMPPYIFRQLIRDPMAASFTGGLNYGPFRAVVMAGTEFLRSSAGQQTASKKLIEKGLVQSGVFTGDPDDMSAFATQLASGKDGPAIDRFFGMLDRAAMRADAATRALVYENALKNGLSEVEADMMTMESMNFYKRGLSPTVQYANRLIPFMNAQIQGLNVLVKAMRGNMPFEERQKIQRKFINNAFMLFGVGLVYAMAMDDDEAFKNAKPKDKYTNFFVNIPGVSEPMKIPLPYESGWFFSAAVALADAMKAETDNKQQLKALREMFLSSVPGYTSMFMPQAVKPLLEVFTNKNFFSGQNIESPAMENRSPEDRFTASTTEAAKALAKVLPLSPVQIEHLARGYFGTAPLAIMAVASGLMRDEGKGEAPERRISETPIIGTLFQRKYGGADADTMYAFAKEATQRAASLKEIQKTGTQQEYKDYLAEHRAEIKLAPMARNYEALMGRIKTEEALVRKRTDLNAEEKRARLDQLDKVRQDISDKFNAAVRKAEAARGA